MYTQLADWLSLIARIGLSYAFAYDVLDRLISGKTFDAPRNRYQFGGAGQPVQALELRYAGSSVADAIDT